MEVGFQDISLFGKDQKEVEPQRLFRDNFNGYESAFFPLQGGWISGGDEAQQAEKLKAESTVEGAKASKAADYCLSEGNYEGRLVLWKDKKTEIEEWVIQLNSSKMIPQDAFGFWWEERIAAIKAGSNVSKQHECIYVGMDIKDGKIYDSAAAMYLLKRDYQEWQASMIAQVLRISNMIATGMYLGQVGMVLAGFDALSGLSDLLFMWETGSPDIVVTITNAKI